MDYRRLQTTQPDVATRPAILVVDDMVDLRDSIAMLLEDDGYEVIDAADGREALRLLLSRGSNVAAIVLDLAMPIMDGWQLLAERRKHPALSKIPTIVVTGVSDATRRQQELGGLAVFTKPFDVDELMTELRRALEERRSKPAVLGF